MVDRTPIGVADQQAHFPDTPAVRRVLAHLCEGDCRAFGDILEWCEARGDCCQAVVCPSCGSQFVIDDDELAELRSWTAANGSVLVCGIRWDDEGRNGA